MQNTKRGMGADFEIPVDVVELADTLTDRGVRIVVTPVEFVNRMAELDKAINVRDADARYEALCYLRDWISEIYEDPDRRVAR